MLETLGIRQQQLLQCLLQHKAGLTAEELVGALAITRTAVNQHLAALERDGIVAKAEMQKTAGRPSRAYALTPKGNNLFPKQYSWFSSLLLEGLKAELGSAGLSRYLRTMGKNQAAQLRSELRSEDKGKQVGELAQLMTQYGYEASIASPAEQQLPVIEAKNCVYHDLAKQYPEVCEFDLGLLSETLQAEVDHQECMVRGGGVCRFKFNQRTKKR